MYVTLPTRAGSSNDKDGVSDVSELLQLDDLQDEAVLGLQAKVDNRLLHTLLKVHVTFPRDVQGGEEIPNEPHDDLDVVGDDLWQVEVPQCSHQDLRSGRAESRIQSSMLAQYTSIQDGNKVAD